VHSSRTDIEAGAIATNLNLQLDNGSQVWTELRGGNEKKAVQLAGFERRRQLMERIKRHLPLPAFFTAPEEVSTWRATTLLVAGEAPSDLSDALKTHLPTEVAAREREAADAQARLPKALEAYTCSRRVRQDEEERLELELARCGDWRELVRSMRFWRTVTLAVCSVETLFSVIGFFTWAGGASYSNLHLVPISIWMDAALGLPVAIALILMAVFVEKTADRFFRDKEASWWAPVAVAASSVGLIIGLARLVTLRWSGSAPAGSLDTGMVVLGSNAVLLLLGLVSVAFVGAAVAAHRKLREANRGVKAWRDTEARYARRLERLRGEEQEAADRVTLYEEQSTRAEELARAFERAVTTARKELADVDAQVTEFQERIRSLHRYLSSLSLAAREAVITRLFTLRHVHTPADEGGAA